MLQMVVPVRRERRLTKFVASMAYSVEFAARAARDLEILYLEKNAAESHAAARWGFRFVLVLHESCVIDLGLIAVRLRTSRRFL
jgi:hypothetical protein